MSTVPQLMIDQLLFPIVELRTNGKHDQQGNLSGTQLQYGHQVQKLDNAPGKYALILSVRSDNDKSVNAPYDFSIEAYAIFIVQQGTDEGDANSKFVLHNGLPVVMGAIRERLADITSRAPWGRFLINAVGLPEAIEIRHI
ncbi:MAG: hypothetical protein ABW278_04650 [Steroidobacteraceae bacterium]